MDIYQAMKRRDKYQPLFRSTFKWTVYYAVQGNSIFCTIQMKAIEEYFPVVLFITLHKVL